MFKCTKEFGGIETTTILVEFAFSLQVVKKLATVD
jgi:hypothetical protein